MLKSKECRRCNNYSSMTAEIIHSKQNIKYDYLTGSMGIFHKTDVFLIGPNYST